MISLVRRETGERASDRIRDAVAASRAHYGPPPPLGLGSFVDAGEVRRKRDPGRCYLRAGFEHDGATEGGLLAFRMPPEAMPAPSRAVGDQLRIGKAA